MPIDDLLPLLDAPPDGVTRRPLDVLDVAALITQEARAAGRPVDAVTVQRLCYLAQGATLAAYRTPLFGDTLEAWARGPVIRRLYDATRSGTLVRDTDLGVPGRAAADEIARAVVAETVARYSEWSAGQLSELSRAQLPWLEAREGLRPDQGSDREIPLSTMTAYFTRIHQAPTGDEPVADRAS